jgi:hypothetical protein
LEGGVDKLVTISIGEREMSITVFRAVTILMLGAMPLLFWYLFMGRVKGSTGAEDQYSLVETMAICSVIYSVLAANRLLNTLPLVWEGRIKPTVGLYYLHIVVVMLLSISSVLLNTISVAKSASLGGDSVAIVTVGSLSRAVGAVFVLSGTVCFIGELVFGKIWESRPVRFGSGSVEVIDTNAYVLAFRWILVPMLVSGIITTLGYLFWPYQSNVPNHAGTFALWFAVSALVKERVIYFKTKSNTKGTGAG